MNLTKSRVFLYFCLSFIFGIATASFFGISAYVSGIFLILALVFIIFAWKKSWAVVIFGFCAIFVVFGIWRFQGKTVLRDNSINFLNGKDKIVFNGMVDVEPDRRSDNQMIVVKVQSLESGNFKDSRIENIEGWVLITTGKYPEYKYGDELQVDGKLQEPKNFEGFDYQAYLAKDDIYSIMYNPKITVSAAGKGSLVNSLLFKIKNAFEEKLLKIFPEPQASLADGLILGEKASLPKSLTDAFAIVGITHIIALSGFNITIIGDNLRKLFNSLMFSQVYSFWVTVVFIIGFVVMTGASASIVRAGVMGILIVLARKAGRIYNIRNALALAATVMIYLNPKVLRFDLGFQLSFLATLGLVYISPLIEKYFQWLPEKFGLRGIGVATFSAQIAVLPLLLLSFGRLSLISPVANILVLPFVPLAMFIVFFGAMIGFIWIKLGVLVGWFGWLLLTYQIKVAEFLAKIPLASVNVKIDGILVVVMYIMLWGSVIKMQKVKSRKKATIKEFDIF
jgi:competence protein ComEC